MRILVIFCHPLEVSFSALLLSRVLEGLTAGGHQTVVLDLYKECFLPALTRQEFLEYRDTSKNQNAVAAYVRQLAEVDGIVLVYPTWWYGLPAMLKGYFDRVLLPGVAFDIAEGGAVTKARLRHIRYIAGVTTYGSGWWLNRLYLGDPGRQLVLRGLRRLCATDCRTRWIAHYGVDRSSKSELQAFSEKVRQKIQTI